MPSKYYKVADNVSISGDLHSGDVIDTSHERFANHDWEFLEKRGDIVPATHDEVKEEEKKVVAPGLAKRVALAQRAEVLAANPNMTEEEYDRQQDVLNTAPTARGDHDVAIQRSRGAEMVPPETVPPEPVPAETPRSRRAGA